MFRLGSIFFLFFALAEVDAQSAYPSGPLTYTIAFGPGGGNDLMSRTVVDIIRQYDLYKDQHIRVENRPGGSGAIGFGIVARQEGNAYAITSTSGNFLATPIISDTGWTYRDFTPIGLLAQDALFLVVRSDSAFNSLEDFVVQARRTDMKVGGTGATGPDRVVAGLLAEAANIRFTYVPFQNGSGLVTGLTSRSLDALVANPSEVMGQVAAGNFRVLGYSGESRSTAYPEVKTFIEQGYEVELALPRGIVMPGGIPPHVRDWWVAVLKEVVSTEEWRQYLDSNSLSAAELWGNEFGDFLDATDSEYRRVLKAFRIIQ